ncbi:MAG TPA: hypothetical protein VMV84_00895 [Dehalococcoidales bacterium]|nr:hypothetical protein [Dehalococcoidales bacterium]
MAPDHLGEVAQEQVEVLVEGEAAVAVGWEEHAPGLDPAGIAYVPSAEQRFLTK